MKELERIFDLDASPRVLVEASAGTGKTYTIVGIYVRMLLEKNLQVDQILTVTFTKKATAELRERILERLRDSLYVLENGVNQAGNDPFLIQLYKEVNDRPAAITKLRRSIHDFDDSQVFTIHGFCQKVLQEEALIAGTPFEMKVSSTDHVTKQAAEDFWRVFMNENSNSAPGRFLISKLLSIAKSPHELIGANKIGSLLSKRYAVSEGEIMNDPKAWLKQVLDLKSEMIELWKGDKDAIIEVLENCDIKRYSHHFESRKKKLELFLQDEMFTYDKPDTLKYFSSDYLCDDSNLKKNGQSVPEHRLFDLCTAYGELVSGIKKVETTLLDLAYRDISKRRDTLSKQTEVRSYDDLLIDIRDALSDLSKGGELAEKLRTRYPVALVDEFQDTDPVQYEIFNRIYPADNSNSILMLIGDPKQAIYAFRGADLHTYFKARKDGVGKEYTLNKNFRSTADYIGAINSIFSGERKPFIEDEISYPLSKAGKPEHKAALMLDGKKQSALQVIAIEGVESSKDRLRKVLLEQSALKIAGLLQMAQTGKAMIGEEPLRAGDIAVLISRHKDAAYLQQQLKQHGVDSVTKTDQNIFDTLEATRLEIMMNAVLNPMNPGIVNSALLTGFFGLELSYMHKLKEDEERRQKLMDELAELRDIWSRSGFYTMFYELIHRDHRLLNIAELDRSERIITNLFHLADLCAMAEKDEELSPRLLHTWLLRQMEDADREDEFELQLESDQHLVKIMTIHSSKGLQFPIVFCPALWEGKIPKSFSNKADQPVEFHKENDSQLTINIDREMSEQRREAVFRSDLESTAEEVRKTYVALTRAQYGCYIYWGVHTDSNFSGLGASILGRQKVIDSIQNKYRVKEDDQLSDATFIDWFRKKEIDSGGRISLEILQLQETDDLQVQLNSDENTFEISEYRGRISLPVKKRMESFSSLAGHSSEPGEPDYDQVLERYTEAFEYEPGSQKISTRTLYQFPRGASAGTVIHKLFENEDFDFSLYHKKDFREIINETLEQYRFDPEWADVLQTMINNVAGAAIPGLDLGSLSQKNELREMEFNFSARGVNGETLLNVIRNGQFSSSSPAVENISMTGFIDLIARQDGRYYIIDYKSNFLGDSPEDYSPDKLEKEMLANSYDLQYHLYTVALVKYLRTSMKDFDYDRHIGGAAYLFVRGMQAGSRNGVWFHKPEKEIIKNLENMLNSPKSAENGEN
ncbi:exodeoxyribonuclease V subunit beta [soil metagenome]